MSKDKQTLKTDTKSSLVPEQSPTDCATVLSTKTNPILGAEMQKPDSRLARTLLNDLFNSILSMLRDRLKLFGRRNSPSRVKAPESGKDQSSDVSFTPSLDEEYLKTERRLFVEDLCKIVGLPLKKVDGDFFTRPFLNPYFIQTSKSLRSGDFPDPNREAPNSYSPDDFFKYAQRVVDNTRGITFSIFDSIYCVYDEVPVDIIDFFSQFIVIWTLIFMQGRFAKVYKLQTTLLFCKATGNKEIPEYEEKDLYPLLKEGYLAGGRFYRYMREKMAPRKAYLAVPFFFSIMQGKRCTQSLSWMDELMSLVKHKNNMQGAAFKGTERCIGSVYEERKVLRERKEGWFGDDWADITLYALYHPETSMYDCVSSFTPISTLQYKGEVEYPKIFGTNGQTTDKAVGKIRYIVKKNLRPRTIKWRPPSVNSTFTHSRSKCGAQGAMIDLLDTSRQYATFKILSEKQYNLNRLKAKKEGYIFPWKNYEEWKARSWCSSKRRQEICFRPTWYRKSLVGFVEQAWKPVPIYGDPCIVLDQSTWYDWVTREGEGNKMFEGFIITPAQVHTVLEPLKARIITAGPADEYHFARCIQKEVFGCLRKDRYMALMGRPHESSYFAEEFVGKQVPEGYFWVAGDYDAATDGMNPRVAMAFCEAVGEVLALNDKEMEIYRSSMCGHEINYPEWAVMSAKELGHDLTPVIQTWGQLMGSPSSFPALCTINLAGFWVSVEEYLGRPVKYTELEKFCVRVNGDDIVFQSDDKLYAIWSRIMKELGLTPSIGKNFQANNWMMINSTCYWIDYEMREGKKYVSNIRDMDHIDPGLVSGRSKVQGDTRHEDLKGYGQEATLLATASKLRQAVKNRSEDIANRMTDCFMYHNGAALKKSDRSWTLPIQFGGLGLPGDCNKSTKLQKLVALKILGQGHEGFNADYMFSQDEINAIFKDIVMGAPEKVTTNAYQPYELPSRFVNKPASGKEGYDLPNFAQLSLGYERENEDGIVFEKTLRLADMTVRKINLDFLNKFDFNELRNITFENKESLVRVRPSCRLNFGTLRNSSSELRKGTEELGIPLTGIFD